MAKLRMICYTDFTDSFKGVPMKKKLSLLLALFTAATVFSSCDLGGLLPQNQSTTSQNEQTDSSNSQNGNINRLDMVTLSKNIDEIAQYDIANNKIFGATYFVYQDGVEFKKSYGVTSLNSSEPITDTSIFRLASMTKPITSVAALILVERGLLSLDDSIDKYIPEFASVDIIDAAYNKSAPLNLPTIRNILTHTSGIGSDAEKLKAMTQNDKKTLDASIAFYIRNGLDFEPGTKQMYSGTGAFDVLTKIIEIVSGMDYLSFLEKEIFQPCGMVDTTFVPDAEQQRRMVALHTKTNGENAVAQTLAGCIFEDFPSTHYLGGAGLVSTLSDYAKFAKMLLNQGKTDNGTILKEKTFKQLCKPQITADIMPGNARWGLGVRVITDDAYPYLPVGSFGWSGAYGTHFWIDPTNNIFAVYMKNSNVDGGAANESAVNFEKAVYSSFAEK